MKMPGEHAGHDHSRDHVATISNADNSNSLTASQQQLLMMPQSGYYLLHYACAAGNHQIFENILQNSQTQQLLDQDNPTKETPLHWAVLKNNFRIVKDLIEEYKRAVGVDEGTKNTNSSAFLHSTVQRES